MRRRLVNLFVLAFAALMLSRCAMALAPAPGLLYTDVKGPHSDSVTTNNAGNKSGTAQCVSILGLVCTGDCSIQTAAANGGIKRISHVDYHTKSILCLYVEHTTIVWGD